MNGGDATKRLSKRTVSWNRTEILLIHYGRRREGRVPSLRKKKSEAAPTV